MGNHDVAAGPFTITIRGEPLPWRPARTLKSGISYTPKRQKDWLTDARNQVALQIRGRKALSGPVKLTLFLWVSIPTSWPKWRQEAARRGEVMPISRPDRTNFQKLVEDALNGLAFEDDSQVVDGVTKKRYAPDSPGVVAVVTPLPENPVTLAEYQRLKQIQAASPAE